MAHLLGTLKDICKGRLCKWTPLSIGGLFTGDFEGRMMEGSGSEAQSSLGALGR
jgi:hypothetical protein